MVRSRSRVLHQRRTRHTIFDDRASPLLSPTVSFTPLSAERFCRNAVKFSNAFGYFSFCRLLYEQRRHLHNFSCQPNIALGTLLPVD